MSGYEFNLPDVGEGIAEAEVEEWLVDVGDEVNQDQPLVSVLTDKASLELTSPVAGTVVELGPSAGERIAVGSLLARFDTDGAGLEARDTPQNDLSAGGDEDGERPDTVNGRQPSASPPLDTAAGGAASSESPPTVSRATSAVVGESAPRPLSSTRRVLASPAVRRRAMEAGVDLRQVPGSGPAERITHEDLDAYLRVPTPIAGTATQPQTSIEDIPVTGVRRVIAERMSVSKSRIPHITLVEEVDVTALEELRATLMERAGEGRPSLTPLAFIALAIVSAVADHPVVNAQYDDDRHVLHRYDGVHLGIATQTNSGLMVPVVRHAETNSLWDMAAQIVRVSNAARNGQLARDDMTGSTITITSLGPLGGLVMTPVINHPEVAIVGVNKRQIRPVWDGTAFVPRSMMNLSCGFDHRIVDGWDAAVFIQSLKELLETPALLFMEGD